MKMYNVLVVDDEKLPRDYIAMLVPKLDPRFAVIGQVADGQEALDFLSHSLSPIDLILTDIRMPVMDGLQLCKAVAEHNIKSKIVIITGHEEFHYAKEALLYNAQDYLLKPIIESEVQGTLERMAVQLEEERTQKYEYLALMQTSSEAKRQIGQRYLRALIDDLSAEVQNLYPLIHRIRLPLLEGDGLICLLSLDEVSMLEERVPPRDYALYRYILFQIASELAESAGNTSAPIWTLLDSEEDTVLFLSGTDRGMLAEQARSLHAAIRTAFLQHTRLHVRSGAGAYAEDIIQVRDAYLAAREAWMTSFSTSSFELAIHDLENEPSEKPSKLMATVEDILSGMWLNHPVILANALHSYVQDIGEPDEAAALRHGALLLRLVARRHGRISSEFLHSAWDRLRRIASDNERTLSHESLVKNYKEMLHQLSVEPARGNPKEAEKEAKSENELDLIGRIKDYIYLHYAEPISLSQLAEQFHVSMTYLSHLFHKSAGEPYVKFLTRLRMERAAICLCKPNMKVFEVAEITGYTNVKHFSFVFKKHYGMTPGEYQTRHIARGTDDYAD